MCGYSATLAVLFYRNFGDASISYVSFFHILSFIASFSCMGGMIIAAIYFFFAMKNIPPSSHAPSSLSASVNAEAPEDKSSDETEKGSAQA